MERVTFVLPTFNGEAFVDQALASIVGQTESNWKAIVIDDVSSDRTEEVVSRYLSTRMSYVKNDANIGLYATLRKVIGYVETEYVSIIHQDDRLHPDYLKVLLSFADQYPAVNALWVGQDRIDGSGRYLRRGVKTEVIKLYEPGIATWAYGLQQGCFWTISGSLTRRSLFDSFPFRTDLPHCGDYDWMLRVLRCAPMLYIAQPLIEIRQHVGQASARHLAHGRDVLEMYWIYKDNYARYQDDVTPSQVLGVCTERSRQTARRAAVAAVRRRWKYAAWLTAYALAYLRLAAEVMRASSRSPRRTPESAAQRGQ